MRKQLRRRNFRPNAEYLESRITPSVPVGVNLDSNSIYNGDPIWTDLHNLSSNWTPLSGSTLALSADGYPLANASVKFTTTNYPNGTYGFSYTGAGTVSFSGVAQSEGPVTVSGGVTTGTVIINHELGDGKTLFMQVNGVVATNPMDNFHLMVPGYGNGTTSEPMFMPAFIEDLEPFTEIRFLNWDMANDSTLANWSSRVGADAFVTDGSGGVPYEDMIELCNEAQKDMWINIPVMATPQFVQSLAQLIYTDLDPNLNVYVEYGNENWNTGFTQYSQVLTAAELNPLVTQSSNTLQMVAQQSAYEEVSDAQIFEQEFGSDSARIRPIMSGWFAYSVYQQNELQFIDQTYGPPSQFIYATAVAGYFSLPAGDDVAGLTLNQDFAEIYQFLSSTFVLDVKTDAGIAQEYGVPLVAYEGGSGFPSGNVLNSAVFTAAENDPRMYQVYVTMINDWEQAGGSLFNDYQLDGGEGQYGDWGLLPNVLAPGSQKYDGLISTILPAGDANLDGVVDYADFQILEANYGDTNTYWKQGDFNDDGMVNWQDLNLLKENLDPAGFTLSEFAQAALFGQLSTVIAGQSLEYDGYGVTYASSMPLAASSGTVELNENSQGNAIVLAGATYTEGLGMLGNSSVSLTLNGQYTRFESTIGVDGISNSGSSVIFNVYGDGQLLYQSPTLTYNSGAIPIDVSVSGVTTLVLTVSAAPGSTPSVDNAVWADARLVSTKNFGSLTPYTLTWQLSQNGTVISTQTTDSFVFAALSGTYTLALTVTDAQGDTAMADTTVVVTPAVAAASYVMFDSHTEGQWVGIYGSQGYDLVGDAVNLPDYAAVTTSGASINTWTANTSAAQALMKPSDNFAVGACWESSTSFTIDVNLTDGQAHDLTLYAVDFDRQDLYEEIQIVNAATGAVLATKTLWSFEEGVYLQWVVSGNVLIKVTNLSGPAAVLSGLFFDPPTTAATYLSGEDGTTEGNWIGTYGTAGYDVINSGSSLPANVTVTSAGTSSYTWPSTTAAQALEVPPNGASRIAACWDSTSNFTVDVDVASGTYNLELYVLDYDNSGRSEQIQLSNAVTGTVLSTETVSNFSTGTYLNWTVSGNVLITITKLSGPNAVLSGIFFDPQVETSTSATFMKNDTTTEGNWIGAYGTAGYDVINSGSSLPANVTVTPAGASSYTWPSTTAAQALEVPPNGASRIAACWDSTSNFAVDVDIASGRTYNLELYVLDYDNRGRSEQIQLSNAVTGTVLSTETVSNFSTGTYLNWTVSGNVLITITKLSGPNAVLSGIFFDPQVETSTSATFMKNDTTTEGNWIGTYGTAGYDVINSGSSLPANVTVTPAGASSYTWPSTTAAQALEVPPNGASRIAACWDSSTSFTVDVDIAPGRTYNLELYVLDYDNRGRSEQIQLSNAVTGTVLSTETVSNLSTGTYLNWTVSGNVLITITKLSGPNAVLSGLFFDP